MNDIKSIIEDVEKSNLVSNKVIKKVIEIIGQEEWNDINDEEDDICTTTGELIITLKGIAELEEVRSKQAELINRDTIRMENLKYQIKKLEKENTELKEKLEHRNCVDCSNHGSNVKLIKAKEIIRKLYNQVCGGCGYDYESIEQAEKFLKE